MQLPLEGVIARVKAATLKQLDDELKCYVPVRGKIFNDEQSFDLMAGIQDFLTHPSQRAVLLLAQSGGGKTLFGQNLVNELWRQNASKLARIPLWINLPSIENPEKNLLSKHLQMIGITEADRHLLLDSCPFFLVLDGADEIVCEQNLFVTNGFEKKILKHLLL